MLWLVVSQEARVDVVEDTFYRDLVSAETKTEQMAGTSQGCILRGGEVDPVEDDKSWKTESTVSCGAKLHLEDFQQESHHGS